MDNKQILSYYSNRVIIRNTDDFRSSLKLRDPAYPLVFDTETTGLTWGMDQYLHTSAGDILFKYPACFGISHAWMVDNTIHVAWCPRYHPMFRISLDILKAPGLKLAHNIKYDFRVCDSNNIPVNTGGMWDDTLTQSRIYWDRRRQHGVQRLMEMLCPEISGWEVAHKKEMKRLRGKYTRAGYPKDYVNFSFVENRITAPYSRGDSFRTLIEWMVLQERAIWR